MTRTPSFSTLHTQSFGTAIGAQGSNPVIGGTPAATHSRTLVLSVKRGQGTIESRGCWQWKCRLHRMLHRMKEVHLLELMFPTRICHLFLQSSKNTSSIEVLWLLDNQSMFNFISQPIDKAYNIVKRVRMGLIGGELVNKLRKLIYIL